MKPFVCERCDNELLVDEDGFCRMCLDEMIDDDHEFDDDDFEDEDFDNSDFTNEKYREAP